jgi:hypothetical protein
MAITAITISQDNIVNGSNLMPVQSSLTFIADVDYTGATPDSIDVEILDESDVVLETYSAVPYKDVTTTQRQFVFKADGPLKALIDDFEDFFQLNETLEYVENITKQFKLKFIDPDTPDYPNLEDQFNNDTDTYYAPKNSWVYVYFYNDDITNDVAIDGPALTEGNALDYDDAIFTDFDDENFTIFTIV